MATPHQALQGLLDRKINLTQSEREQGSTSHNNIRQLLIGKSQRDNTFPWLLDGDFLSGSFARKTKVRPLDDIDVIMVLDGHGLQKVEYGQVRNDIVVRGSGRSGSPVNKLTYHPNLISSKLIVEKFAEALSESFPQSNIKADGQAVNVQFTSLGLGLDIVPAFHLLPVGGGAGHYYIPKGGDSHDWMDTNPKMDMDICNSIHAHHNGNFKPVLRLIKYWAKNARGVDLKSYHVEAIAWKIFESLEPTTSFSVALFYFFQNAENYLANQLPDPTGLGSPVDNYLSSVTRQAALQAFASAKAISLAALQYEAAGEHENAIIEWEKLLGNLR